MHLLISAKEVHTVTFHVNVASLEEGLEEANSLLEEGYEEGELEYSHTLGRDQWIVVDEDTLEHLQ